MDVTEAAGQPHLLSFMRLRATSESIYNITAHKDRTEVARLAKSNVGDVFAVNISGGLNFGIITGRLPS